MWLVIFSLKKMRKEQPKSRGEIRSQIILFFSRIFKWKELSLLLIGVQKSQNFCWFHIVSVMNIGLMNLMDLLTYFRLIWKRDLRLLLLAKMRLQKLYLIPFFLMLLLELLSLGILFNGILELKLLLFRNLFWRKMVILCPFILWGLLEQRTRIRLFPFRMIARFVSGILENLLILK